MAPEINPQIPQNTEPMKFSIGPQTIEQVQTMLLEKVNGPQILEEKKKRGRKPTIIKPAKSWMVWDQGENGVIYES